MATPSEILKKLNIKYEDLRADERAIYTQWEESLKGEITVDKIKDFLKTEINAVEMEWSNPELSKDRDNFLKAEFRIAKTLLALIESPQRTQEWLSNHLNSILPKTNAS